MYELVGPVLAKLALQLSGAYSDKIEDIAVVETHTEDGKEKAILKDISVKIDERFVAITGPNGGGKSTLAKIIAGIYTPTSGKILLDGVDITDMIITERARLGISYGFQHPPRFKALKVRDFL